jgi:NADH:ubiquinone oxidoreductase subunit B-like Fe-S oxidoreductase
MAASLYTFCTLVHLLHACASTGGVFYTWNAVQSYDEGPRM